MANSIGSVNFHTMTAPEFPSKKTVFYARTGVDGHGVWLAGNRGQVFQVRTTADYADLAAAHSAYQVDYKELLGQLVAMTWESDDITGSLNVVPLDVRHPGGVRNAIYKCLITQGGLLNGTNINSARVIADWQLLAIAPGS